MIEVIDVFKIKMIELVIEVVMFGGVMLDVIFMTGGSVCLLILWVGVE